MRKFHREHYLVLSFSTSTSCHFQFPFISEGLYCRYNAYADDLAIYTSAKSAQAVGDVVNVDTKTLKVSYGGKIPMHISNVSSMHSIDYSMYLRTLKYV